ncbi:helix-turn-helix domain-containing protein [Terrisporobacter vanillatitrophus]|uniref:helix-turn-helix domain-containing protein n=1 Tax=Terrisporobacter vanillatitrophus TaxID=3058402 RepID=UPI003368DFA7
MLRKSKIDFETKIKSVEMYLNGEKGPMAICKMIRVGKIAFYEWIHKYEKHGAEGLKTSSKNKFYSNEVKMFAINNYISGKV